MKKANGIKKIAYVFLMLSFLVVTACGLGEAGSGHQNQNDSANNTGFIVTKAGMYDSADFKALLVKKNADEKTVTFFNKTLNRRYTLNYNGTSKIYDKYGTAMSMEQVNPGCIVDITFLKTKKLLNSMTMSVDAWTYTDLSDFSINEEEKSMTINGSKYILDGDVRVYSDGKEGALMDINNVDKISVSGIDTAVYSIIIEEGHGYLRLKHEDYFVGGWIEIGSKIIKTIEENMLIAVPIGTYDVLVSNNGFEGIKTVTIEKNQEAVLDIGDIRTEEPTEFGTVIIVVTPSNAEVYIDGDEIDTSKPQKMEYGIHQLIASAQGYQSLTQYIKVGQESATLDITLDKEIAPITPVPRITDIPIPSPTPIPVPTTIPSSDVVSVKTINGHKVTISTPTEVEIYVDGSYVGISPTSFAKVSGPHEITLRKDGYITRSYTISIDKTERDETFSFSDLEKENSDDDNSDNDDDDDDDDDD